MAFEKWNPLRELETMRREMDRIWDELFTPGRRQAEASWKRPASETGIASPPIDIIDKNNEVIVKAEMPGVSKENIDISLQDSTLTLKGELKDDSAVKDGNYTYSERNYHYYSRALTIPFKIDQSKIKANLKDGILYIHLPKVAEEQPKKINVEIS